MSETKVKRYGVVSSLRCGLLCDDIEEMEDGDLVRWEDHERSIAIARVEGKREGLRMAASVHIETARLLLETRKRLGTNGQISLQMAGELMEYAIEFRKMAREVKP